MSDLLRRPYRPPRLFIFEEVELSSGIHTLNTCTIKKEQPWSAPYQRSGSSWYRSRVVEVQYPPKGMVPE